MESSCKWYLRKLSNNDGNTIMVKHSLKENEEIKKGLELIVNVSEKLGFPIPTRCTALLYFQVFYSHNNTTTYPVMDIALTTILVASKAEETLVNVKDILLAAFSTLNDSFIIPSINDAHIKKVTQYELAILECIDFNFNLQNVIDLYSLMERKMPAFKREKGLKRTLDSYMHSNIILFYPIEMIIIASIYLDMLGQISTTPLHSLRVSLKIRRKDFDDLTKLMEFL